MSGFKLWIGAFPGGDLYCNSAVEEHGDYQNLALVGHRGEVLWYEKPEKIPPDVRSRIVRESRRKQTAFEKTVRMAAESGGHTWAVIYERLLDSLPLRDMLRLFDTCHTSGEKVDFLINFYKKEVA